MKERPSNPWHRYESLKKTWLLRHPDATPPQYQEFITKLARELGI